MVIASNNQLLDTKKQANLYQSQAHQLVKATTNTVCIHVIIQLCYNFMITYVTGSAKTVPNCARTEIKFTAKH